jgi:regulatory associated protein of mTOR
MCAFIIAMFCKDFPRGQSGCLSEELIESCLSYFGDMQNPLLRQWSCLCLSMLFHDYPEAKWLGIKCGAHQRLCDLVVDCVAEVRVAMLHALTNFLGIPGLTPQVAHIEESIASMVLIMASDGNSMVRKELLVFFSHFVVRYRKRFLVSAFELLLDEKQRPYEDDASDKSRKGSKQNQGDDDISSNTVFSAVWKEILILSVDPHPEIAEMACALTDYVFSNLLLSPLGQYAQPLVDVMLLQRTSTTSSRSSYVEVPHPQPGRPPTPPTPSRSEGYFSASLKRTASVAASLKNLAWGSSTNLVDMAAGLAPSPRPGTDSSRQSSQADPRPATQPFKEPLPSGFHQASEDQIRIPLESKFLDWSVEYFREPQMQPPEAEEPGSVDYNHRLWRRNRNDKTIAKTQPLKELAGSSPWDKPKGFWNNGTQPMKLCWHQFEEHLIVTDDKDGIS